MGKIVLFLGPSASGKDTIVRRLIKENKYPFKEIIMHTTRPMRTGELNGREYFFDTITEKEELERQNKIIEIREYNTKFGIWYYYTVENEINLQQNNYIGSNTLIGLDKYIAWGGVENILPILIQTEDKIRIHRALEREDKERNPKYDEMCRRFLADKEDFSLEEIRKRPSIEIVENNSSIENTMKKVDLILKKRL